MDKYRGVDSEKGVERMAMVVLPGRGSGAWGAILLFF